MLLLSKTRPPLAHATTHNTHPCLRVNVVIPCRPCYTPQPTQIPHPVSAGSGQSPGCALLSAVDEGPSFHARGQPHSHRGADKLRQAAHDGAGVAADRAATPHTVCCLPACMHACINASSTDVCVIVCYYHGGTACIRVHTRQRVCVLEEYVRVCL